MMQPLPAMLSAIQERIGERELAGWKKLKAVVDKAAQLTGIATLSEQIRASEHRGCRPVRK